MFERKAQITIFVIIGIVLLLGALSYFYLSNSQVENSLDSQFELSDDQDIAMIQQQVLVCADSVLHDASIEAARTNFFCSLSSTLQPEGVPYFYFAGKTFLPEKIVIERKFSDFMTPLFLDCLDDFSSVTPYLSDSLIYDAHLVDVKVIMDYTELSAIVDLSSSLEGDSSSIIPVISKSIDSDIGSLFHASELTIFSSSTDPTSFFDDAKSFSKKSDLEYQLSFYSVPGTGMLFSIKGSTIDSSYGRSLRIFFRMQSGV